MSWQGGKNARRRVHVCTRVATTYLLTLLVAGLLLVSCGASKTQTNTHAQRELTTRAQMRDSSTNLLRWVEYRMVVKDTVWSIREGTQSTTSVISVDTVRRVVEVRDTAYYSAKPTSIVPTYTAAEVGGGYSPVAVACAVLWLLLFVAILLLMWLQNRTTR